MKICYLADAGSIHTQRWIEYFANKGHEVYLISQRSFGNETLKNVNLHLLKTIPQMRVVPYPINLFYNAMQVKRLIKKIKPDILHAHYITDYGVIGAITDFHPFVSTGWGSDILISPKKSKITKFLVRYTLKHTDLFTSDSDYLKETAISYGAPKDNSYVIQWGVDLKLFNPLSNSKIKSELDLKNNCQVVISTRSFEPIYNIDTIIKSIPIVLNEANDVKFVLKNGYGTKGSELMNLARKMGVLDSTIIIDKMLDYGQMSNYLNMSDIFVSVPSSDSTPVSLLEAMACGLPVIVSDLPANREWVKDGWNGFIVPIKDSNVLAEAIIKLLRNEELQKLFGQRNYELINEKANHEKHMEKMEGLYQSLIDR